MKIPKPETYITGEQDKGYEKIDEFFRLILEEEIKLPQNHPHIERRLMGMKRLDNEIENDERAHILLYKQQIIGVVIETRTDSNYIHFDYFFNSKSL